MPWRAVGVGLVAGALVLVVFLAYRHYEGLVEENRVLSADVASLRAAKELQDDTIEAQADALREWREAAEDVRRAAEDLQRAATAARAETRRLSDIFARHDLESLALQKPGLVENRINAGTRDAVRLLECASGAGREDCPGADRATR